MTRTSGTARFASAAIFLATLIASCASVGAEEPQEYFEKTFFAPENPGDGVLAIDVEWRIWIPSDVKTLRGVVVHHHGCGDGSGYSGRTAVYDLHWQALARKYDCALIAPSYQLHDRPCELWCDPRNGSAQSFLDALDYFAEYTGREELTRVPWALWGHSGGGQWVASTTQLYPERVICAWCRSGAPDTVVKTFDELPLTDVALNTPMMMNVGANEYDFGFVWVSCWSYFTQMRERGAKIGFIIDPHTSHETGDSRYPAIRFIDMCLSKRLPDEPGSAELKPIGDGIVVSIDALTDEELAAPDPNSKSLSENLYDAKRRREALKDGIWLPCAEYEPIWRAYLHDAGIVDETAPPAPTDAKITRAGKLTWNVRADVETGLSKLRLYEGDKMIFETPCLPSVTARPLFQGVMYSDSPDYALPGPEANVESFAPRADASYFLTAVNAAGLESEKAPVALVDEE